MKLNYISLVSTNPYLNLAAEEYVFDSLPKDRSYFMLWQNANAVIIGRYQNAYAEINENFVREHDIKVARRLSGGGAVYHDIGNLNFTYITDVGETEVLDLQRFSMPVVVALNRMGIKAKLNGRNDMTIDGKKISGNSQYIRGERVMHHGTLMFDSDLSALSSALNVSSDKIAAKGIKSVRSRVCNIKPYMAGDALSVDDFRRILLEQFLSDNPGERYDLSTADMAEIEKLADTKYRQWEWNFGKSPACSIVRKKRIDGVGGVEAHMELSGGRISELCFYGDFFSTEDPFALSCHLVGCRLMEEELVCALSGIDAGRYFSGMSPVQLTALLLGN